MTASAGRSKRRNGLLGSSHAAIVRAVRGREVETIRRPAAEEKAVVERARQHGVRCGLPGQRAAIGAANMRRWARRRRAAARHDERPIRGRKLVPRRHGRSRPGSRLTPSSARPRHRKKHSITGQPNRADIIGSVRTSRTLPNTRVPARRDIEKHLLVYDFRYRGHYRGALNPRRKRAHDGADPLRAVVGCCFL
jgi:hypothetical protein